MSRARTGAVKLRIRPVWGKGCFAEGWEVALVKGAQGWRMERTAAGVRRDAVLPDPARTARTAVLEQCAAAISKVITELEKLQCPELRCGFITSTRPAPANIIPCLVALASKPNSHRACFIDGDLQPPFPLPAALCGRKWQC